MGDLLLELTRPLVDRYERVIVLSPDHFNRSRQHSRGDDAAHSGACLVGRWESSKQCTDTFGAFHNAQNDSCGNAESTFGADENTGEIVAGRV